MDNQFRTTSHDEKSDILVFCNRYKPFVDGPLSGRDHVILFGRAAPGLGLRQALAIRQ